MRTRLLSVPSYAMALALCVMLITVACDGGQAPAPAPTAILLPAPTNTSVLAEVATTALAAPPSATSPMGTQSAPNMTYGAILDVLVAAGIPIGEITVYTGGEDPDPASGYIAQPTVKVNWHDKRLKVPADTSKVKVLDGGGLEFYADFMEAQARFSQLGQAHDVDPSMSEYDHLNGSVVLRLSGKLTPAQAEQYTTIFEALPLQ